MCSRRLPGYATWCWIRFRAPCVVDAEAGNEVVARESGAPMLRDLVVRSEVGAGKDSAVGTVDGKQRGILERMDEVVS